VKPAKARRSGHKVDGNGESTQDHIRGDEKLVSLRPRRNVASCAEIGVGGLVTPRVSEFIIEPPRSHMEFDRRIDVFDLPPGSVAQWYQ
jgi:hypothetical protein